MRATSTSEHTVHSPLVVSLPCVQHQMRVCCEQTRGTPNTQHTPPFAQPCQLRCDRHNLTRRRTTSKFSNDVCDDLAGRAYDRAGGGRWIACGGRNTVCDYSGHQQHTQGPWVRRLCHHRVSARQQCVHRALDARTSIDIRACSIRFFLT